MSLVSVRLITDDVRRMVEFYETVLGTTASWSNEDFAEVASTVGTLAIGSTRTVGIFAPGAARPADNHSAIVEFLVDNVDEEFARLQPTGVDVVTEPTTMPWGNRSLVLRDPDGNLVNLFTPASAAAIEKFAHYPR